ncbi:MAG: hypothetical protein Q9166_002118 [cf. Caloplaca sp. 2 TL-2023]
MADSVTLSFMCKEATRSASGSNPTPDSSLTFAYSAREREDQPDPRPVYLTPLRSIFSNEIVTVEVGPERVPFSVHKGLICGHSTFLNAAFNGSFKEAAMQSIPLEEESPKVFDIIHKWLYTKRLTGAKDGQDVPLTRYKCLDLYVLGDNFDMPDICDAAINHIGERTAEQRGLSTNFILWVYARTGPSSTLRDFITTIIMQSPGITLMRLLYSTQMSYRAVPKYWWTYSRALTRGLHRHTRGEMFTFVTTADTNQINPVRKRGLVEIMQRSSCM